MVRKRRSEDELNRLLARADQGDRSVLPALRKMLDEGSDYWEQLGNLGLQVERSLIKLAAGKNELAQEAMERRLENMRAWLAGPSATPLERLLADRIVMCWLEVHQADRICAGHHQDGGILALGDYYQRRQDRAHRRYLQAIRTLAQVRRLLGPTMQVNIGRQQVNVAR